MSTTKQRDAAILLAFRKELREQPTAARAAAAVLGGLFEPATAPTAEEQHWVKVIRTAIDRMPDAGEGG